MMEEVGIVPAQPVELVAGHLGRPDLRQHVERPGREPRQHPVAARRRRSSRINKNTGKLVWEDNSVEDRILHGQWSTPVGRHDRRRRSGRLARRATAGCAATRPDRQEAVGVRHQPEGFGLAEDAQRADRARRSSIEDRVYIANGQDPEHGEGVGHFYAIDATKRGDITQTRPRLALRQDPPVDLDGGDRRRAASTSRTSAASSTASTRRPARSTGRTTCSPPSGARRWSSTARSTSATRTATSSSCRHGKEKKVLAEMNMGSAVYAHAGAGPRRAVPQQPQPAVRARGRSSSARHARPRRRRRSRGRCWRSSALALLAPRPGGRPTGARRADDWPQFRGNAAADRRLGQPRRPPRSSCSGPTRPATSSSRRPRSPTASSTSAAATATCSRSTSRPASCAGSTRPAASIGESSPAVGGGRVYIGDLDGVVHAVRRRRRQAARGRSRPSGEIKSSPVVVGDARAHRLVRRAPLRARRRDRQAALEVRRPTARCTRRRPCRTASPSSPAATRCFRAIRVADGTRAVRDRVRRLHRRVAGHRRRPRLLRHVQQRGAGARPQDAQDRCGATAIPTGSSRSTRRRRSSTAA